VLGLQCRETRYDWTGVCKGIADLAAQADCFWLCAALMFAIRVVKSLWLQVVMAIGTAMQGLRRRTDPLLLTADLCKGNKKETMGVKEQVSRAHQLVKLKYLSIIEFLKAGSHKHYLN